MRGLVKSIALLSLAGCQPGSSGPFEPVATPGVAVYRTETGPIARLLRPGFFVDISGNWASVGWQSIVVTYVTDDLTPIALDPRHFALRRGREQFALGSMVDATDMRPDRVPPPPFFNADTTPMVRSITLPAGSTRRIEMSFDAPEGGVVAGQSLTLDVALPSGKPAEIMLRSAEHT